MNIITLAERVLLYAPSHRQDTTYHGFVVGLGQEWKQLNGSTMRDRSDNPLISLPFTVQVIGVRARARACVTGKHIIECVYNLHLIRRYQFIFNLILDYNPQI